MVRILFISLLISLGDPCAQANEKPVIVNAVGCSLFDSQGRLLKKYLGWICGYFPNGKMLLGDGFTLTFYDEKMHVVWSRDMHAHHVLNYSPDDQTALVTASRILNGTTRIDRLEVYDIEGHLLRAFDFTEAMSYWRGPQSWDQLALPGIRDELTLIESFHRVGKNSSHLPFLSEGNYVAYDAGGRLYFFDRDLKAIVHQVNVRDWGIGSLRDVQVTSDGTLLMYNSGHVWKGKPFTALEERDPETGKVVWHYEAKPPTAFYGPYEGNVQRLPNGNVIYSVVMDELKGKERRLPPYEDAEPWMDVQGRHRIFEITREGKMVWSISNDGSGLSGMPNSGRRLDISDYYRHKGRY